MKDLEFNAVDGGKYEAWFYDNFLSSYEFEEEAKWALFFEMLNIRVFYNKKPIDRYSFVATFYIPIINAQICIACEGKDNEKMLNDCHSFHRIVVDDYGIEPRVIFIEGLPRYNNQEETWEYLGTRIHVNDGIDEHYLFCECPICHRYGIEFDGRSARVMHSDACLIERTNCSDKIYNHATRSLIRSGDIACGDYFHPEHIEGSKNMARGK